MQVQSYSEEFTSRAEFQALVELRDGLLEVGLDFPLVG